MRFKLKRQTLLNAFKMLSLILTLTVIFSMTGQSFIYVDAADTDSEPQWNSQGSVKLNKTAEATDKYNEWKIKLTIDGMNYKSKTDVVLVIDTSNSMNSNFQGKSENDYSNQKIAYVKRAANQFVSSLIDSSNSNRIAIVSFSKTATINTQGYDLASSFKRNKYSLKTAINSLIANEGTNMQAGLHTAQKLLDSSNAQNKVIVILGDGKPTYGYKITSSTGVTVNHLIETKDKKEIVSHTVSFADNASFVFNYSDENIVGDGTLTSENIYHCPVCEENVKIKDNFFRTTIYEAKTIKDKGTNIYSIAFGADEQGEQTLKAISSNTKNTDGFYKEIPFGTSDSQMKTILNNTFEEIGASILSAAKNGIVSDPMGDMFELCSDAKDISVSQGTVQISDDKRKINWSVGTIAEGKTATMTYIVRIKDSAESGKLYPTNERTTFKYKNYKGLDTTKDFPIPSEGINYGKIHIICYLSDSGGNPIDQNGQHLSSLQSGYVLKEYNYTQNSDEKIPYGTACTVNAPTIENSVFVGSCLDKLPTAAQNSQSVTITKEHNQYTVYFAYTVTGKSLKIVKSGDLKPNESSVFKITGSDGNSVYQTIQGSGSKTIVNLKVGDNYTITEVTDWSWKYSAATDKIQQICICSDDGKNVVSFENKGGSKLLSDESFAENKFSKYEYKVS